MVPFILSNSLRSRTFRPLAVLALIEGVAGLPLAELATAAVERVFLLADALEVFVPFLDPLLILAASVM